VSRLHHRALRTAIQSRALGPRVLPCAGIPKSTRRGPPRRAQLMEAETEAVACTPTLPQSQKWTSPRQIAPGTCHRLRPETLLLTVMPPSEVMMAFLPWWRTCVWTAMMSMTCWRSLILLHNENAQGLRAVTRSCGTHFLVPSASSLGVSLRHKGTRRRTRGDNGQAGAQERLVLQRSAISSKSTILVFKDRRVSSTVAPCKWRDTEGSSLQANGLITPSRRQKAPMYYFFAVACSLDVKGERL
jgi:hypothetical protein